jgi:serine/threonine protein kinase
VKKPLPFGKYYLLERINVGGMAEVFKAKSFGVEGFERIVAVKRILPSIAEDQDFITMFIDEAKVAVQLTHANIAQIFDLGKVGDSYFIAMEYVHGRDVRAIFDRARKNSQPVPIPMACYTIMKVCEGLDYAHNKKDAAGRDLNLVHRDVSPQNILISYDGEIKVIDFGIAKAASRSAKTQAGILKGKFGYMSPEQVRGLPLDRRSDIFSIGIVLYELLTLERLFQGESDFSTLEKVRNVEIMPPSTYNPRIPDELEQIVLKALSKEVEDRYQTAMDLHDDLQSFMYTSGNFFARKDLAGFLKAAFPEGDTSAAGPPPRPSSNAGSIASAAAFTAPATPNRAAPSNLTPVSKAGLAKHSSAPPGPPRASAPPQPPRAVRPSSTADQTGRNGLGLSPVTTPDRDPPRPPPNVLLSKEAASPSEIPQDLAAGPVATPLAEDSRPPSLDMEWDDDELATQVYDKPSDLLAIPSAEGTPVDPTLRSAAFPGSPSNDDGFAGGPPRVGGRGNGTSSPNPGSPSTDAFIAGRATADPMARTNLWGDQPEGLVSRTDSTPSKPRAAERHSPPAPRPSRSSVRPSRTSGYERSGSKAIVVVVLLLGVLLAAGLSYLAWLSNHRPGTISGTVRPPGAQVLLGDEAVEVDEEGRFTIAGLSPSSYLLHFRAEGHRDETVTVTVEAGGAAPVAVVLTAQDRPPADTNTGLAVRVQPAGAAIFVDDERLAETTPAEHIALPPGTYAVRVEKEGYLSLTDRVTVSQGYVVTISRHLQPETVQVNLHLSPSEARCRLFQEGQEPEGVGRQFKVMPHRSPTLECTAEGYREHRSALRIPDDGSVEAAVYVSLEADAEAAPAPTKIRANLQPRPAPTPRQRTAGNPKRGTKTTPNDRPPRPTPQKRGPGFLSVNTRPWTKVYVDGRFVRNTPLLRHQLPSGPHRLTLINEEFEIHENMPFRIQPGENTQIVRNLVR